MTCTFRTSFRDNGRSPVLRRLTASFTAVAIAILAGPGSLTASPFVIKVVDDVTGRGVPLVQLKTVNDVDFWTDSAGIVALDEPGFEGRDVYLHLHSPGYELPPDMFDFRGVKLKPVKDGKAEIKVKRTQIAERLYRITGEGIYRDSILAGLPAPLTEPVLNALVLGQDSVVAAPYKGRIFWTWGDTNRLSFPLGNFCTSGAFSDLPGKGGLDPDKGINLEYLTAEDGFVKPMCKLPGGGLIWVESLAAVPDATGNERLVARVARHKNLEETRDWHLMVYNDERREFESVQRWDIHEGHLAAHAFRAQTNGVDYLYLCPDLRVRRTVEAMRNLAGYEVFTCVAGDGKWHGDATEVDRDENKRVRYSWKAGATWLLPEQRDQLKRRGTLKHEETARPLVDFSHGKPFDAGLGSVFWNLWRQRWIDIFSGSPGEIWFAEADTPLGPWGYAVKVAEHGDYNFYNPTQHPFFDQDGGRLVYFEGTYTDSFSGAKVKTPRYDYNQIMYRLTLSDPRLSIPLPVYQIGNGKTARLAMRESVARDNAWASVRSAPFFAVPPSRAGENFVPVYQAKEGSLGLTPAAEDGKPLFQGYRAAGEGRVPLVPRREADGAMSYVAEPDSKEKPLCYVWRNPAPVLIMDASIQP
jgi:hypothetical protein